MFSRTFQANPYAIGHRYPLWVHSVTLKTFLKKEKNLHSQIIRFYVKSSLNKSNFHFCATEILREINAISCHFDIKHDFCDFFVTQILREINFGESRSPKKLHFFHFRGSEFSFGKFQHSISKIHKKSKFKASKC